jgi:hypothetical protein
MRKKLAAVGVVVVGIQSASLANEPEMIVKSSPQKAAVYTEGRCVFEEQLAENFDSRAAIRLPAETDINSIEVSRGTERLSDIKVIPAMQQVEHKPKEASGGAADEQGSPQLLHYLLKLNKDSGEKNSQPLTLRYAVKGISWTPLEKAEVSETGETRLCLDAVIRNEVASFSSMAVSLIATPKQKAPTKEEKNQHPYNQEEPTEEYCSWRDMPFSRSLYAEYSVGSMALPKTAEGTSLVNIFCKNTDKAEVRHSWNTKDRKVKKTTYIKNPYSSPLCDASMTVVKNSVIVKKVDSEWAEANEPLLLLEEDADAVVCSSSVEVTENFKKRNMWENCRRSRNQDDSPCDTKNALFYNHQYEFTCQNDSGGAVKVDVVFNKKYGLDYKNIYNFKEEPAKSPGWWHVWELELGQKEKKSIKFDIDSDRKSYNDYKKYGKAMEGC